MKKGLIYAVASVLFPIMVTVFYKLFTWMWGVEDDTLKLLTGVMSVILGIVVYCYYFLED